jgi:hypothetical protein
MKVSALALVFTASFLAGQQPAPSPLPSPLGVVTGRVICGDTDQPGRFATVQLIGEKPQSGELAIDPSATNPDMQRALTVVLSSMLKGSGLSALTGLDGSFTLDHVPAGTYYVVAQLPGYQSPLSQFSQIERMKSGPDTLKAVEAVAEKIVVQANQPARVELRLERGASLSGTVHYDDGSPAPGVTPILMTREPDGKWKDLALALMPNPTDDLGRFRFSGLLPGKYAVKAALPTMQASVGLGAGSLGLHMSSGDALVVYSGGALRQKDLKPLEVGSGETIDGVDITFPLTDLHKITGTVVAKADGHAVNFGTVSLLDPDTKDSMRMALIGRDGAFQFNYVPDGAYMLHVNGAADTQAPDAANSSESDLARMLNSKVLKTYGTLEQPLTLKGDAPDLTLQVPDAPAKKQGGN